MKNNLLKKMPVSAIALAVAATAGTQAIAQSGATLLEELVVTARKREENLLETPIAITAFGSEEIQNLGLEDIEDIQLFTPGFVFESFATTPGRFDQSPRFRGIDIDTGDPFRQTASVFLDGLYIVNGAAGIMLNDVERVEVIKGPQSAFFGRNTFGGAVNYITKTPGNEFKARVSASVATRDDYEFSGSIEGALIEDVLAGRLSVSYHDDGGHYDNVAVPGEDLGEEETLSVSATLAFTPSDRFSARLRVGYFENDDGAPAVSIVDTTQHNCGPFPPGTRTGVCGNLPINAPAATTNQSQAFFDNMVFYNPLLGPRDAFGFDRENLTVGASFDFELTDSITLSGLFGYSDEDTRLLLDFDALPQTIFSSANNRQFEMDSQEIRLSGIHFDDRLQWTLGYSIFDQQSTNAGGFIFGTSPSRTTPVATNVEKVETKGIFGSVSYGITDQLRITLEGRSQEDEIFDDADISSGTPDQGTFDNFIPRAILDYQMTDETLLYLSYAEGNNPGGFNGEVSNLDAANLAALLLIDPLVADVFDEEILESIEFGIKHGFANGKGYISAAIYSMDRSGQQFRTSVTDPTVNAGATVTYFLNRGETGIQGFELEGSYSFTDSFTLTGGVGYTDAEYEVVADTVHLNYFGTLDASGKQAPRFPKVSGSLSAIFEDDFGTGLPLFARVDASYVGSRYADISNLPKVDSGVILNLRAGMRADDYSVELFVKNATDSDLPTGVNRTSDAGTFFSTYAYRTGLRDRRQIGARVTYDF